MVLHLGQVRSQVFVDSSVLLVGMICSRSRCKAAILIWWFSIVVSGSLGVVDQVYESPDAECSLARCCVSLGSSDDSRSEMMEPWRSRSPSLDMFDCIL